MAAVLITSPSIDQAGLAVLREAGLDWHMLEAYPDEASLIDAIERLQPEAILVRMASLPAAPIRAARRLRVIAKHGVGVDTIDIRAATECGVPVAIAPASNASAVAEHALAMMLGLAKRLCCLDRRLRAGHWDKGSHRSRDLEGATLALIGLGAIGRRVASHARAFGMRIVAFDPYVRGALPEGVLRLSSLEQALSAADIVSLHCPLNESTRGLIGRAALAAMKPGALLVNTARGGVVDEAALADALEGGRLAGAALDTFEQEPPDPASPLLRREDVLLSPHVASTSEGAFRNMAVGAARNIVDALRGPGLSRANVVNPEVLARSGLRP